MTKDLEDIAGRALDALDPEERRRFDELADADAIAELMQMQETAAALGAAVAVTPPAALRARIFEQVAATEQLPATSGDEADQVDDETVIEREPALVGGGSTSAGPRERAAQSRWFQRPASMLAAAAAAVVLLVGGVGIGQAMRAPDGVSALVNASDVSTQTASLADGARATLLWSHDEGEVALVFEDLSALEQEQVYEAWFMRDGEPIAAGTFEGGDGSVVHLLEGDLQEGDAVAITIEPAGGSDQPTSQALLQMTT